MRTPVPHYCLHLQWLALALLALAGSKGGSGFVHTRTVQPRPRTAQPLRAALPNDESPSSPSRVSLRGTAVEVTAADLLTLRSEGLPNLEFVAECALPTKHGQFRLRAYRSGDGSEPTVLVCGDVHGHDVLLRVHDQCFTSEVLGSSRCDCHEQLEESLSLIAAKGRGLVIYLQQEGRGIGLPNKVAAYALQDQGLDTVEANLALGFPEEGRSYTDVPAMLCDLGVESVELLTNNPFKLTSLTELGVDVRARVPLVPAPTATNVAYLRTKASRMRHLLPDDALLASTTAPAAEAAEAPDSRESEDMGAALFVNPATGKEHRWCLGEASVEQAVAAVSRGELVLVTDDQDRENEGDLIMAAEMATPEAIAFMIRSFFRALVRRLAPLPNACVVTMAILGAHRALAACLGRHTSGVLCAAMTAERLGELALPQMVPDNQDPKQTAFALSVDAARDHGVSTGISASDRATTMRLLADPATTAGDLSRPGHVFPLRARSGGVLVRNGHTEAAADLCALAGLQSAGVLSEVCSKDGLTMARTPELVSFAREHGLAMTTIEDLICYRLSHRLPPPA